MAKNIWQQLEDLYGLHFDSHKGKLSSLAIREQKTVPVTFQGESSSQPAVLFKVVDKDTSHGGQPKLHNVLIAKDRKTGALTIWCGDTSVVKSDKETEDRCEYWRKRKTSPTDSYMCMHCVYVFQNLDSTKRAHIAAEVDEGVSQVSGAERLSVALKHGKSAFVFGPTGSGKTHTVFEALHAGSREIHPINITDGLTDVDLLQKLLPGPDGGWTRKVGELRAAFDAAVNKKVVIVFEEAMRSSRSLRNLLVKALDNQGGNYVLHDITTGERISVPASNMLFCATANLNYADTSKLDPALARRFPVFIFLDYDVSKERSLLEERLDASTAGKLLKVARQIRLQYRQGRLPMPLDTGSLLQWADLIKEGVDMVEAAYMTWLFRVVELDSVGYPEEGQQDAITTLLLQAA